MLNSLAAFMIIAGILSLLFFVATLVSLRKKRFLNSLFRLLIALLALTVSALFATIIVAASGYRAFMHEEVAAIVQIEPFGNKRFAAHFQFPDGLSASYELEGDQLYVDAHILKWKPVVNMLGLHTAYELDRVGGRFADIEDEIKRPRTVYLLSKPKPIDLITLHRRYAFLKKLLDAEYGSATFMGSENEATYEIRISTTGLLMRETERPKL